MRNETVLQHWTLAVSCWLVLAASAGPYPSVVGLAETAVGLAERTLLAAGTVWLAITLLKPRGRTPEVKR